MRIALIAPPWLPVPPSAYGGTESVLDTLARALREAGHDVVLATTGDSTCPVERTWVYEHGMMGEPGSVSVELRHVLHAYAAVGDVDVVHDHTIAGPVVSAAFPGVPVVTTNHGPFTDDAVAIYRSIAPRVAIVAISHDQASRAQGVPIARVIHHGLNVAEFPFGDGAGGYLAFLGRMSPTKGVREAIEIARGAGAPLLIAAKMQEPSEREYFDAVVSPRLGGDVRYLGNLGHADKLELLAHAVALVDPIRWPEPFGLCMIEALACGTPVLVTPRGAAPEIVDDGVTGFVRPGVGELTSLVPRVASLDRHACRAAAESRFSAERMASAHVALYEEVLSRRQDRATIHISRPAGEVGEPTTGPMTATAAVRRASA